MSSSYYNAACLYYMFAFIMILLIIKSLITFALGWTVTNVVVIPLTIKVLYIWKPLKKVGLGSKYASIITIRFSPDYIWPVTKNNICGNRQVTNAILCPCIFISTLKLWLYMVYFTQRNQALYSLSYFKSVLAYETILKHI